jgi:hypothetical protein
MCKNGLSPVGISKVLSVCFDDQLRNATTWGIGHGVQHLSGRATAHLVARILHQHLLMLVNARPSKTDGHR